MMVFYVHSVFSPKVFYLGKIWKDWSLFSIQFPFKWVYFRGGKPRRCFSIYVKKWRSCFHPLIIAVLSLSSLAALSNCRAAASKIIRGKLGKLSKKVKDYSANVLFIIHDSYTSYIIDIVWIIFWYDNNYDEVRWGKICHAFFCCIKTLCEVDQKWAICIIFSLTWQKFRKLLHTATLQWWQFWVPSLPKNLLHYLSS